MENVKDNEIDLRLALGIANQQDETFSNTDAGANANTNSNSNSLTNKILGHGSLTELVWSTQNGLSIKCGVCSATMNPCDEMFENDGEVKCVHFNETKTHNKGKGKECMSIPVGNGAGKTEANDPEIPRNIILKQDVRETTSCGPIKLDEKIEETAENDPIVKAVENLGEDSSEESLESCNSGSKKSRRRDFEHQLMSRSKRLKKQSQESGMVKKQDSSFMNWISNMVKPHQQDGAHHPVGNKPVDNVMSKIFGFQSVFQSLYSQRLEETKTLDNVASPGCKTRVAVTSSYEIDALKRATPNAMITCFVCGKTGHESRDCLQINKNQNFFLKKKVGASNLNQTASTSENKLLNQDKILRIPKDMFDTIRRLRLSRTDILKWMNSRSTVANLDGYFLRLRLAKWEEGVGGACYYVACITDENPSKGFKQPLRVNVGGVQCLVECRYISNCDFLEDELIAWWQTMMKGGRALMETDLTSKLEEKKKLGLSIT